MALAGDLQIFFIPIASQTIVAPASISFLKSLTLLCWRLLFPVSVGMHPQITVMELDHFGGFSVIVLAVSLYHSHSQLNQRPQYNHSSCKLLMQYIIIRLCHNLLLCCVKFSCFTFDTVHMQFLNLPLQTFYLNFRQFTCFQNTPNLACQVLLLQLKQSRVLSVLMHSLS